MTNISISSIIANMNNIKSPYTEKLRENERNETKKKFATIGILGAIAIAAVLGTKIMEKPTEYSGAKSYTFETYQGLNDATMAVDRDPNQVRYQEVTDHIKEMPENAQALSDGIQVGETITIPESAYKK